MGEHVLWAERSGLQLTVKSSTMHLYAYLEDVCTCICHVGSMHTSRSGILLHHPPPTLGRELALLIEGRIYICTVSTEHQYRGCTLSTRMVP